MRVLVTGGAGFIGSHLVDQLLAHGHAVRVLDHLEAPTHTSSTPAHLDRRAELIRASVGDMDALNAALLGIDAIFHLAATGGFRAGTERYLELNSLHTARLVDALGRLKQPPRRVVVASSVAVYGEGAYQCPTHGKCFPPARDDKQLKAGSWELLCSQCGAELAPIATDELKPVSPERAYSLSKYDQERLVLGVGDDLGIQTVALRYFVTYGPRQSLTNPYTGVISLFANRIRNGLPPVLYEDGKQSRDFIFVEDLVRAHLLVLEADNLPSRVMNVGSGQRTTIADLARCVSAALNSSIEPELPGRYRQGDVRHIGADISRIRELGFEPQHSLERGVEQAVLWLTDQPVVPDGFQAAEQEGAAANLIRDREMS